jgi:hypothetical protein
MQKTRTPLHRPTNGCILSLQQKGKANGFLSSSILVHILAETRSFLSSTRHDIDPPFVASSLRRSHRSSFPSVAWSWRERQPLDPVAAVGSGKGSDTNKRNWTGAVPLGARPWRRICRRLVQGEMVLIFPLSLLAAYFG